MNYELLSRAANVEAQKGRSGVIRLEGMNTSVENRAGSLASNVDLRPLVLLVRNYETKPNLVLPLILSGIGMQVEDGQICVANPTVIDEIIGATQEPLSEELIAATTDLVTLGVDRMIVALEENRQFDTNHTLDVLDELTVGNYASLMLEEQPEVRKIFTRYAQDHSGDLITLEQVLQKLRGEQVEDQQKEMQPQYPKPDDERVGIIKKLSQDLQLHSLELKPGFNGLELAFNKSRVGFSGESGDPKKVLALAIEVTRDFVAYSQWRFQKGITVSADTQRIEFDFLENGANTPYAELKTGYFGGLTLTLTPADFSQRDARRGVLNNPNMRIGSMGSISKEEQEKFLQTYLERFGEIEEQEERLLQQRVKQVNLG